MPKKISSKRKFQRRKPVVQIQLIRHAEESEARNSGLTPHGEQEAIQIGKRHRKEYELALRHSEEKRARSSAVLAAHGFRSKGGTVYQQMRERKVLGSNWIYHNNPANRQKIYERYLMQGSKFILWEWLNNRIDPSVVIPPQTVAERVIREEISLGHFLRQWPVEKNVTISNISHGWIIAAVFERMAGKKLPRNSGIAENQGLTFTFDPRNNRIFMRFRDSKLEPKINIKYDVTDAYWEIVGKPPANQKQK